MKNTQDQSVIMDTVLASKGSDSEKINGSSNTQLLLKYILEQCIVLCPDSPIAYGKGAVYSYCL